MPKLYVGAGNTARKSKKVYVGVNNTARKCKKIYVGDSINKARLCYMCLPTTLKFYGGKYDTGFFDYAGQRYSYNCNAQGTGSITIDLYNETETLLFYSSLSQQNYTAVIRAGQNNNVYLRPASAIYWYGLLFENLLPFEIGDSTGANLSYQEFDTRLFFELYMPGYRIPNDAAVGVAFPNANNKNAIIRASSSVYSEDPFYNYVDVHGQNFYNDLDVTTFVSGGTVVTPNVVSNYNLGTAAFTSGDQTAIGLGINARSPVDYSWQQDLYVYGIYLSE